MTSCVRWRQCCDVMGDVSVTPQETTLPVVFENAKDADFLEIRKNRILSISL